MNISKTKKVDFSNQHIYVGIDVHKTSWHVSILTSNNDYQRFTQIPEPDLLIRHLRKHYPGGQCKVAYEAGFCGFWIYRNFKNRGIDCKVINPADLPVTDKQKRTKTDRVDSYRIAKGLKTQMLKAIYVPDEQAIADRQLLRQRLIYTKELTRCKNRIKSMLNLYGADPGHKDNYLRQYWSNHYISQLQQIDFTYSSNTIVLKNYIDDLRQVREKISKITRQIRNLSDTVRYKDRVRLLRSIPGIGLLSSMVLLTELVDINRFKGQDELQSYIGLVPEERSSGETQWVGGVTPRRNKVLRNIIIESSWVLVRKDPAMAQKYNEYTKRMQGCKAIVKIARKLISRIAMVLRTGNEYKTGIL